MEEALGESALGPTGPAGAGLRGSGPVSSFGPDAAPKAGCHVGALWFGFSHVPEEMCVLLLF